ncbi:disease resistance protein RPV1-like isoform X2 [Eucalyptus grandis]|nr:disease resistance protein RPV1-like isoform X2 [Eucalyptus grandis]
MPNLKFLKLYRGTFVGDINNNLQELRWLSWHFPPLDPGMANLHLKNLVLFELSNNKNTDNWGGWNILKMENKLKVLSLVNCDGLKQILDFSRCVSLEILSLSYCQSLQEVDSIGKLKDLTHLKINWCRNLRNFPKEIGGLVNLKHLSLNGCFKFKKLPDIGKLASLSKLDIAQTKITILPDSIGNAKKLSSLDLSGTSIKELPISIGELMQLEFLSLSYCHNFVELPRINRLFDKITDVGSLGDRNY